MLKHIKLKVRERQKTEGYKLPDPQPKQAEFLNCEADVALYGGSAGSGKSFAALLMLAAPEYLAQPKYRAVVFRTSYPEIAAPGSIWDESQELYLALLAKANHSKYTWTFPSGASIKMSYLARREDVYKWKGSQLDLIVFEELTEFKRDGDAMFWYMLSRARSRAGLTPKVRATTNPDADSWVRDLIDWWIGADGYPIPERSGKLRWFVRRGDEIEWGDTREELIRDPDDDPKSFTFIAGLIHDNQKLLESNPGYLANLKSQHPVEMERLLKGNWNIRFEKGEIYQAAWFQIAEPEEIEAVRPLITARFWDLAATPRGVSKDSYYTVGVLMSIYENRTYLVRDVIYTQISAGQVPNLMLETAQSDGRNTIVCWEQEPATGGVFFTAETKKKLHEFSTFAIPPDGSKRARALPYAAAAHRGDVFLAPARWNRIYTQKLEEFDGTPEPLVADFSDASAGCFEFLTRRLKMWTRRIPGSIGSVGGWDVR